jgi:hypothetical protein
MSNPRTPDPLLLVVAAFSRHESALEWARARLEESFGPVERMSPVFDFDQTSYYEPTMGPGLRKRFLVFRDLVPPERLAAIKLATNDLEEDLARTGPYREPRPLNLDPGLLTLGKFMLATTKDKDHRIYLRDGIYAEVTLRFTAGAFEPWTWTYADYREAAVRAFLNEAREYYRSRLRSPCLPARES